MNMDWKDALAGLLPDDYTPADESTPADETAAKPCNDRLHVILDRKGRKGKTATIISGFTIADEQVEELAATLKRRLGTGGSARGGEILIQGDRADDVLKALTDLGYKAVKN